jgi:hypothetical protein
MRQLFLDRLKAVLNEKTVGSWRDGWVYGRLKQEFELQPDELDAIAKILGFKYGWNAALEKLLWQQWQLEESRWQQQELKAAKQQLNKRQQDANIAQEINMTKIAKDLCDDGIFDRELTAIEKKLMKIILTMNAEEQLWLLDVIFEGRKS